MTVNVEADPVHVRMMLDFFEHHKVSQANNIAVYAAVGARDGWASLPIVEQNNWGAGVVSFSEQGTGLDNLPDSGQKFRWRHVRRLANSHSDDRRHN
jgi:hypothetical protein